MRILYVTTVGVTMSFFENYIKTLEADGHEVSIACNNSGGDLPEFYHTNGNKHYNLSGSRNPFSTGNVKAIKEIKKIVENEKYDIVHCHTPIAAACCRIACRKARKNGTKVIYTAHGFHFYKGAPLKNWLIFYPIERICARFTDVLITINKEDYELAKKKFKARCVECVPGVGIDVKKFAECEVDVSKKRQELGIPNDAYLLLSVGELNQNKNHQSVIKAIAAVKSEKIHYMIAGQGGLKEDLLSLAKELGIAERLHLLGYRNDVNELYKTADLYVHPSFREGLPTSVIEAMASGKPIICTDIRGSAEVVKNGYNGILVKPNDIEAIKNAIIELKNSYGEIGANNTDEAQRFDVTSVNEKLLTIYFD